MGKNHIKNSIVIFIILGLITSNIVFISLYFSDENQAGKPLSPLTNENVSRPAQTQIHITETDRVNIPPFGDSLSELQFRGFRGTPEDIIEDLIQNHQDIIPYEGVLGGTMALRKDRIWVLTHEWVLAGFDDGHIGGYLLLQYDVTEDNMLWKVIDSYLYGDE